MSVIQRTFLRFSLVLLLSTLFFGVLSSWAFLFPEVYNNILPFHQLRPIHVSAALFWIITGTASCVFCYKNELWQYSRAEEGLGHFFMVLWMATIVIAFINYSFDNYGGGTYWELPPYLNLPLLAGWMCFIFAYFKPVTRGMPVYAWMWGTGILFFLITFLERKLGQIIWLREGVLNEFNVQWKATGLMIGAWNQMLYGICFFLLEKISRNTGTAKSRKAFLFYFLGLFNLVFSLGYHIYDAGGTAWIRYIIYIGNMAEWLFLIGVLRNFRAGISERMKLKYAVSYRFIISAEFWVVVNLLLALLMSVPAINYYINSTHVTVALVMGSTIGINSLILLACISYMLRVDEQSVVLQKTVRAAIRLNNISLFFFLTALITAGVLTDFLSDVQPGSGFSIIWKPAFPFLLFFAVAGFGILAALGTIVMIYMGLRAAPEPVEAHPKDKLLYTTQP